MTKSSVFRMPIHKQSLDRMDRICCCRQVLFWLQAYLLLSSLLLLHLQDGSSPLLQCLLAPFLSQSSPSIHSMALSILHTSCSLWLPHKARATSCSRSLLQSPSIFVGSQRHGCGAALWQYGHLNPTPLCQCFFRYDDQAVVPMVIPQAMNHLPDT